MKLLLDTHVWVWMRLDPDRLDARARRRIEDSSNEVWLSPISAWELLQLADRGRLRLSPDAPTWIRNSIATMAVSVAPIGVEIAIASRRIDLPHDDPADRFLAATAQILDLTLVTADERLLACRDMKTLRA